MILGFLNWVLPLIETSIGNFALLLGRGGNCDEHS
jgi:hypothetical protein